MLLVVGVEQRELDKGALVAALGPGRGDGELGLDLDPAGDGLVRRRLVVGVGGRVARRVLAALALGRAEHLGRDGRAQRPHGRHTGADDAHARLDGAPDSDRNKVLRDVCRLGKDEQPLEAKDRYDRDAVSAC